MLQKDIIYGDITLNGIYEEIVNSTDFMRLKDITQTAMSSIKYKQLQGETRYEHSIGVYYLMCKTLQSIENKLKAQNIKIVDEEKEMAKLAALLHDIGHGVNSHLLEQITGVSHEQRGIDIINDPSTKIHQIITNHYGEEFIEKLVDFMNCIYGKGEINEAIKINDDRTISLKELLATLISHNIDLDRLDYLMRESTYTNFGTLSNYNELIDSFECILAGNQIVLAIPQEKMHLIEANILERMRNYSYIYFHDIDFIGDYAFKQLLNELRKKPKEVPYTVSPAIRKFLTQEKFELSNSEYMELTNKPLQEAVKQIALSTKNEKIKYLCSYKENAETDYKVLYNGRSEAYIRKLLGKVIPTFPKNSQSVFYEERIIVPYRKTKFGSTNIITNEGIKNFEELPHAISLAPIKKTILAFNPEYLRIELGLSKNEFDKQYLDVINEIITNQSKPIQEFELKYLVPQGGISYSNMLKSLEEKYTRQDSSNYESTDVYYDSPEDFELLSKGNALRIRDGVTFHEGVATRNYKNRRITYKTYVEEGNTTYTNRAKQEEIGDTTNLKDYKEFLEEIGLTKNIVPILTVHNLRRLVTFLVNGKPIDISFNVANYDSILNTSGTISIIEIRPRENQIVGRLDLLEIQQVIENKFPQLKSMSSTANIYEIAVMQSYENFKYNLKQIVLSNVNLDSLCQIVNKIKSKKGVQFICKNKPYEPQI